MLDGSRNRNGNFNRRKCWRYEYMLSLAKESNIKMPEPAAPWYLQIFSIVNVLIAFSLIAFHSNVECDNRTVFRVQCLWHIWLETSYSFVRAYLPNIEHEFDARKDNIWLDSSTVWWTQQLLMSENPLNERRIYERKWKFWWRCNIWMVRPRTTIQWITFEYITQGLVYLKPTCHATQYCALMVIILLESLTN